MSKLFIFRICGIRKKKPQDKGKRACWYFISPFGFQFILAYFNDQMWNVLGTEINRRVEEMKNPLNYEVIEKPSDWLIDIIESPEGKEVLEHNKGVLVVFEEKEKLDEIYH